MKNLFWVFGLLCSGVVNAQQTFFTIPSGEITHKGKHFYQVQANFVDIHSTQAKFDFDYGIGHHWELGFNIDTDLSWKKHTKFLEVSSLFLFLFLFLIILSHSRKDTQKHQYQKSK